MAKLRTLCWLVVTARSSALGGLALAALAAGIAPGAELRPPAVLDDRLQLERLAAQPQIVTPTGACFDRRGRLLVIESHTHMRPEGYAGPPADRIRMVEDADGDGRVERWSTFHEGLQQAMNVEQHPNGSVYVLARAALVRLQDTDDDGRADRQTEIVRLESTCTYPHNGLMGLDIARDGTLYFGLGENLGEAYRMVGSDGVEWRGGGEGGSIYRCREDGTHLERIATGFWNPYGLCLDPCGRLFCAENDPDASPPCRLLHIVPGGDYGYQFRYGRSGQHPLQTWTGTLPGTLGMVCGLSEAACELVAYRGQLWVASWGDHRIERYRLVPQGASFRATREVVVQGDADFRPVGLAVAPDGALYFSDWVDVSYPVHGRGALWRLAWREPPGEAAPFPALLDAERQAGALRERPTLDGLRTDDPFVRTAAAWGLARQADVEAVAWAGLPDAAQRLGVLQALRWRQGRLSPDTLRTALRDPDAEVRIYAVRAIADQRLGELREPLLELLNSPSLDGRQYLVYLAAVDWLDNGTVANSGEISDKLLVRELTDGQRPAAVQALALRFLGPDDPYLTRERLRAYLQQDEPALRLEAVRTLAQQASPERLPLLAEVARDAAQADAVRLEAISGLGTTGQTYTPLLEEFAAAGPAAFQREATRALRRAGLRPAAKEPKPDPRDVSDWLKLLEPAGDAEAGRRLFFSPAGPRCAVCHRFAGRGGRIGPDLTQIGRTASRERIVTSILQPSAEIAPEFVAWSIVTDDGRARVGLMHPRPTSPDKAVFYDDAGNTFTVATAEIEEQLPSRTSIMPAGLEQLVTVDELRDLLAFLAGGHAS